MFEEDFFYSMSSLVGANHSTSPHLSTDLDEPTTSARPLGIFPGVPSEILPAFGVMVVEDCHHIRLKKKAQK